jgi:hypothetical protein
MIIFGYILRLPPKLINYHQNQFAGSYAWAYGRLAVTLANLRSPEVGRRMWSPVLRGWVLMVAGGWLLAGGRRERDDGGSLARR